MSFVIILPGINRTFMELKLAKSIKEDRRRHVLIEPLWNWNRKNTQTEQMKQGVLIEPLWNWNLVGILIKSTFGSINRTFMELKLTI